jgi:metal-responsive CopG/Arc/MetJ family transcriptional regulator
MAKVAISLPDEILATLDQRAEAQRLSRSTYIRQLLEAQLAQQEEEEIVAALKEIYDEIAEDEIATSEAWLANSSAQNLEPYDWTPEERDAFSASR